MNATENRSPVFHYESIRSGNGSLRRWTRVIRGTRYSFTAVTMPDGERRYVAKRYNGYVGGPKFSCAWDLVLEWTIR